MRIMMLGEAVNFCKEHEEIKEFWIDRTIPKQERLLFFCYPGLPIDSEDTAQHFKESYPYINSAEFYLLDNKKKLLKDGLDSVNPIYCSKS